jgi:hypothetical protein
MPSRPVDEIIAARAGRKFVAGADDRSAAAEDPTAPFCARTPPSALELERMLTLDEVAEFRGLSNERVKDST